MDFNNTKVAFATKSNAELKRALSLFEMIKVPTMVKMGSSLLNLSFKLGLPVKGLVKKTVFNHFCGGENIQDCSTVIEKNGTQGVMTILDYSVEGQSFESVFEHTLKELLRTAEEAKQNDYIPFTVFKVTGIARFELLAKSNDPNQELSPLEREEWQRVFKRVDQLCGTAAAYGVPILIDAEETWIQDSIDRLATAMMKKYNKEKAIVYNTLQMYRTDRVDFLKKEIEIAKREQYFLAYKLVRGAYMEKERERAAEMNYPSPINETKAKTDEMFNEGLRVCMDHIDIISVLNGTHNEDSSILLTELMKEKGIEKSDKRVFFAQLLGMSDHISFNLANEGYNICKYVPYGPVKDVMPYLIRRAEENTSVAGQTGRELTLIRTEIKRRKNEN